MQAQIQDNFHAIVDAAPEAARAAAARMADRLDLEHATIDWSVDVRDFGEGRSLACVSVRSTPADADARERLLDSWKVVGPAVRDHARRMLRAIKECAEDVEVRCEPVLAPALLRAA
jgi:hypothetical protein